MSHRLLPYLLLAAALFTAAAAAQTPALPASPQMRYVDFSKDLGRANVVVVVGTLCKGKDGKRERVADGKLGGGAQVAVVSGTQYFKVPVQAAVQPRATFCGKADKLLLAFDVQLARLPDGQEQRQAMTGSAAPMAEGMLALFVVAPRDKPKGFELLHVIPFDKAQDQGPDADAMFLDTMNDFYAVNRRVFELGTALATLEKAADPAGKQVALTALKDLLAHPLELRRSQDDALLTQHVAPLESRATKRLADAAAAAAGGETGK